MRGRADVETLVEKAEAVAPISFDNPAGVRQTPGHADLVHRCGAVGPLKLHERGKAVA